MGSGFRHALPAVALTLIYSAYSAAAEPAFNVEAPAPAQAQQRAPAAQTPPAAATQLTPRVELFSPRSSAKQVRQVVSDILSDRAARTVTFGLDNYLNTPFWSAVKTGTSKDMRDNWCIGFSRRFTVGVWVGNFEGDSMHDVSGVTGAAPVWHDLMMALHARLPSTAPPLPRPCGRSS
jgi:membrane carboxypeptidase/penicillin-binding protein PbpC